MRTRIYLGPKLAPSSPGSGTSSVGPFFDISRARGEREFAFEAPDEPFGFTIAEMDGFEIGPAIGFEGKRKRNDLGPPLHEVGFALEAGAFAQFWLADPLRVRVEARRGVTGHDGWTGSVSADYVVRDGDDWLVSVGPRVTISDASYHRAYFGVTAADRTASGLPVYTPGGGIQAVGVTAGALWQFDPRWGVAGFARYDRLTGDAAASPVVRNLGSRDQPSLGIALSYTFGRR